MCFTVLLTETGMANGEGSDGTTAGMTSVTIDGISDVTIVETRGQSFLQDTTYYFVGSLDAGNAVDCVVAGTTVVTTGGVQTMQTGANAEVQVATDRACLHATSAATKSDVRTAMRSRGVDVKLHLARKEAVHGVATHHVTSACLHAIATSEAEVVEAEAVGATDSAIGRTVVAIEKVGGIDQFVTTEVRVATDRDARIECRHVTFVVTSDHHLHAKQVAAEVGVEEAAVVVDLIGMEVAVGVVEAEEEVGASGNATNDHLRPEVRTAMVVKTGAKVQ